MDAASEQEFLAKLRSGDAQALGPYLELHRQDLIAFLRRITGDHLLGILALDDLYQEVATSAWTAFPKVSGPNLEPMPWLLQLARRKVADAYRFHFGAQRRSHNQVRLLEAAGSGDEKLGLEELLISSITSPSAVVSRNIRLSRIDQALEELGDEAATIVRMRYVDGLTTHEIAERLQKTEVAIRVTLSRSLKKLSDKLGES